MSRTAGRALLQIQVESAYTLLAKAFAYEGAADERRGTEDEEGRRHQSRLAQPLGCRFAGRRSRLTATAFSRLPVSVTGRAVSPAPDRSPATTHQIVK
jgi:hypothetical protein